VQRSTGPSYIPTLDGWRAVAIIGVLLCHAFDQESIFNLGELGVMLFFGISGFLITNRMLRECEKTGRLSLRNFYIRRVFRILPPAFFYLAVVYLLGRLGVISSTGKEILACIFFVRNYVTGLGWYTSHFWSLSVEEHFYLIWPAIFVLAGRKRAMWVAPLLALATIVWRTVDGHYQIALHLANNPALGPGNPFRSDYCADGLFWGCSLALWLPLVHRAPRVIGTPLCVLIAAVVLGTRYIGVSHNYAIAGVGMALLLGCTVLKPESWLGRFLELKPIRFVGRISYSLYLWQMLFLTWFPQYAWQHLPLNLVFAFACAIFSYYVIERPLIKMGHWLTHVRVPQEAVAA
jgi:peptidoglycan/LPS O-acetylase OafA/YrhL